MTPEERNKLIPLYGRFNQPSPKALWVGVSKATRDTPKGETG